MFDQLRDLLNDGADTQVTYLSKKLYINRGVSRLWPSAYKLVSTTIALTYDTFEYALAAAVMSGHIVSVEINSASYPTQFSRFDHYDIIPGDEDLAGAIVLNVNPETGSSLRIRYAAPIPLVAATTYAAAQSETWGGPDRYIHLPVLYAMGMIAARKLDDREDHTRMSTVQNENGTDEADIVRTSQLWFGQYELELSDMARPLPVAHD